MSKGNRETLAEARVTIRLSRSAPSRCARLCSVGTFVFLYCGWIGFLKQERRVTQGFQQQLWGILSHTHSLTHAHQRGAPLQSVHTAGRMVPTEACKCARDKLVNIYPGSHYAFGIKQGSGSGWPHIFFFLNYVYSILMPASEFTARSF